MKKTVKTAEVKTTPETATEVKTTATEVKTPETAKKSTKAKTKAEPKVEEVKTETTVETPVEVKTEETKPDFKKSDKENLIGVLRTNFKAVKDEALKDSIKYTVSRKDKATLADLRNLVREVKKALGKEFNETPTYIAKAEASLKKAEKVETPVSEKPEPKKAKKKSTKDSDTVSEKAVQLATSSVFPEVIKEYGEEYHLAHEVKTLADLEKATENGAEMMIACLWTKRHLRQFRYFNGWLGQPKSFKNDLDLCQLIWCTSKVAYAVSNDTEAIYNFFPEDIVEEDGIRCCNGLEYQIYRKTGEVETEEPDDEEDDDE